MADDRTEDPTLLNKLEGVTIFDKPSSEVIGPSEVKEPMGLKAPQKEMSGSSQVKELTEVNLRGQSPIELKFPSELNDALSETRRLHVFDDHVWFDVKTRHGNIDRYLKLTHFTRINKQKSKIGIVPSICHIQCRCTGGSCPGRYCSRHQIRRRILFYSGGFSTKKGHSLRKISFLRYRDILHSHTCFL
ncbi:uncharacterized protein LOC135154950 [Lytechinus pictus]|uniref:uncharacterized protein LOC135154950 n=1 Tax=Lytechinus pictus TaxID=7653 RepID=UPI0030BA18E1